MIARCLNCMLLVPSLVWSAADENNGLLFEVWSPSHVQSRESRIEVIQRITNTTSEAIESALLYAWHSDFPDDYFDITRDGKLLQRKLAEVDFVRKKTTTLQPGESVTVAFYLDALCLLPEPAKRAGIYRLEVHRNARDQGGTALPLVAPSDLWIIVLDAVPERVVPVPKPVAKGNLAALKSLLEADTIWPADRLRILEEIAKMRDEDLLWRSVESLLTRKEVEEFAPEDWQIQWQCKDVYAVVSMLRKLPRELLAPGYLYALCRTPDLALRRAALEAMVRGGPDRRVAARLSQFLAHQSDELVSELGKKALSTLQE